LAREGGFLLHAASAVRDGEAHIFTGRSGAGKTTLSRLAPPDATLLTDEVSYVRKSESGYIAYGTPFAGELAKAGENISAPIAAVYLLVQGPENRLEQMDEAETVRTLMRNILFFAQDEATVQNVFKSACAFAAESSHVPHDLHAQQRGVGHDRRSQADRDDGMSDRYIARSPRGSLPASWGTRWS
jgi:ABC-type dipeptide/oligopeptide/nickel transport system ATPase subunit